MVFSLCCRSLIFQRPPKKWSTDTNESTHRDRRKVPTGFITLTSENYNGIFQGIDRSFCICLSVTWNKISPVNSRSMLPWWSGPVKGETVLWHWKYTNPASGLSVWVLWPCTLLTKPPQLDSRWSQNIHIIEQRWYPVDMSNSTHPPPTLYLLHIFFMSQKQQPCATKWTRTLFFRSVGKWCRSDTPDQSHCQRLFGWLCWQPWSIFEG